MKALTIAKRNELLLELADAIEAGSEDWVFDIGTWCGRKNGEVRRCAIGIACTMESFNKIGFRLDAGNCPKYGESTGWRAVESFMGANGEFSTEKAEKDSEHLFWMGNYPNHNDTTPKEVAYRIRQYV